MTRRVLAYAAERSLPQPISLMDSFETIVNAMVRMMESSPPPSTLRGFANHARKLLAGVRLYLGFMLVPFTYRLMLYRLLASIPPTHDVLANRLHLAVYHSLKGWEVTDCALSTDGRVLSCMARPLHPRRLRDYLMVKRLDVMLIHGRTRTHFLVRSSVQLRPLGPLIRQRTAGRLEYVNVSGRP